MAYITFSLVWSLGANIHDKSRREFASTIRQVIKPLYSDLPDGDIYEFGIDKERHALVSWNEQIPEFRYNPSLSFFEILVPTSDTVKYKFLLQTLVSSGYNVLISGETGVGKSVVTKDFLKHTSEDIVNACVNFSGKTTTKNL